MEPTKIESETRFYRVAKEKKLLSALETLLTSAKRAGDTIRCISIRQAALKVISTRRAVIL